MRRLAIPWGIGGTVAVLVDALWRLAPVAAEALAMDLAAGHLALLALWVPGMAWSEGYRGFHRRFAPRLVARAWHLSRAPRALHLLLAPLYCMGFFHTTRRRLVATWALAAAIVALVLGVRTLDQPWRGIVDLGVVVGLGLGTLSILGLSLAAIQQGGSDVDPELPPGQPNRAGPQAGGVSPR